MWVALLFVGLQQLEGHVVAPQIFGHTLRINPLLVIFALLLGLQIHGIVGALVALPILAVLRETVVYLSRHLTFEPWESRERDRCCERGRCASRRARRKRYGERRRRCADVSFEAAARASCVAVIGPNGAGKTTLLSILAGCSSAERGQRQPRRPREVGWVPQQPALYARLSVAENLALFARLEGVADPQAAVARDARADRPARARRRARRAPVRRQPPARERRPRADRRPAGARAGRALGGARPAPARAAVAVHRGARAASGTSVVFSTHNVAEAQRYADARARARRRAAAASTARPAELLAGQRAGGEGDDLERAFVRFLAHASSGESDGRA